MLAKLIFLTAFLNQLYTHATQKYRSKFDILDVEFDTITKNFCAEFDTFDVSNLTPKPSKTQ
jgi:hypothetical protein